MTNLTERTLHRLSTQLSGRLSKPGDDRYAAATAIWAKPVGRTPRAIAHCRTSQDVQSAIRAARECGLPLSVRGGGHDWAGRALCDGIVIDLSGMKGVIVGPDNRAAKFREAPAPRTFSPCDRSVRPRGSDGLVQLRGHDRTDTRRRYGTYRSLWTCARQSPKRRARLFSRSARWKSA
jgi:hypothetical protein